MNRSKLSIGNFVSYNNDIWVVETLGRNTVYLKNTKNDCVSENVSYNDINGVPITIPNVEELLKIEFEEDHNEKLFASSFTRYWYDKKTHTIQLSCFYAFHDNDWYVHVDNNDYDTSAGCEVKYINELQNILNILE